MGPQLRVRVVTLADAHTPGHLGVVAVLRLAGDLDPLLPGLLAEGLGATGARLGAGRGGGVLAELDVGDAESDRDLLAIDHDLRRSRLPFCGRRPANQPITRSRASSVIMLT